MYHTDCQCGMLMMLLTVDVGTRMGVLSSANPCNGAAGLTHAVRRREQKPPP